VSDYWDTPRHNCLNYCTEHGGGHGECLPKAEFDKLLDEGAFVDGPFRETFGSGHGEPYNPNRQAFGRLKDGRVVFMELNKP